MTNIKISNGMDFIKRNWRKWAVFAYALAVPLSKVYAVIETCDPGKICNPIEAESVNGLIKTILEGVLKIGFPIVALAIIYCGFLFVFARGNSEKLTKARQSLLYTLIGAAILLGSWAIAELISETVRTL